MKNSGDKANSSKIGSVMREQRLNKEIRMITRVIV